MWRVMRSARSSRGSNGELVPSPCQSARAFSFPIFLPCYSANFWTGCGPTAVADMLQLWSSGSSRCWACQWAPVSLNFAEGEKGSLQGAFWLLGVIFRYFWAVRQKASVLSNIPNLNKVAHSWEKQELGLEGQAPKVTCAVLSTPTSTSEGWQAAAWFHQDLGEALHYSSSHPFPNSCSPPPATEKPKMWWKHPVGCIWPTGHDAGAG